MSSENDLYTFSSNVVYHEDEQHWILYHHWWWTRIRSRKCIRLISYQSRWLFVRNVSSTSVLSCNNLSNTNSLSQRKLIREPLIPLNTQRLDRRHVITKSDIVSRCAMELSSKGIPDFLDGCVRRWRSCYSTSDWSKEWFEKNCRCISSFIRWTKGEFFSQSSCIHSSFSPA